MKSPFKFLDPYNLGDKKIFFGRKKETILLHRLLLRTRLLILYGLSGTGKTSLIQCGLANEFNGPDWLPIWIRRQDNINLSLQASVKRIYPAVVGTLLEQIQQIYQRYLRPIYIIFDQFEELFILGDDEEQQLFISTLETILYSNLPCTILLVIREEYLGRLYPFEKAVPNLFDYRMRIEAMNSDAVKEVVRKSFNFFNISIDIQEESEQKIDEILKNVGRERSGIELPYLQVYLDQLYKNALDKTDNELILSDNEQWPRVIISDDDIEKVGKINIVLDRFLVEQINQIQDKLSETAQNIPRDAAKAILDGFVSEEGTKRPIRYKRIHGAMYIDSNQLEHFPNIFSFLLIECIDALEVAKILRIEDEYIELAHDSLAQIIDSRRSDEQRERNNIRNQIKLAVITFPKTGEYLTLKQVTLFEDTLSDLPRLEADFLEKSRKFRKQEISFALAKEKSRNTNLKKALIFACLAFLVAILGGLLAWKNQRQAENNLLRFKETEFNSYKLDAETFIKSKNYAEAQIAYDSARSIMLRNFTGTEKSTYMQREIEYINNKLLNR